jgi:hypothetical protein
LGARFLTRDPLEAITRSAYGYVDNNPVNGTDPTGLDECNRPDGGIGGFFGSLVDCVANPTSLWEANVETGRQVVDAVRSDGSVVGTVCPFYGCVGVSFDLATLDLNIHYGLGLAVAAGVTYYRSPAPSGERDEWFATYSAATVGGSRRDADGCEPGPWDNSSVGAGYGVKFGAGLLHWYR